MSNALFQPLTLRGMTARNRIWVPPMCQYAATNRDGIANQWHLVHYGALAAGGAGAITVEATSVVPEGRISTQCLGLWNDAQTEAFRPITEFAHAQGAAIGIQLNHAGRKASGHPAWGMPKQGMAPAADGGWPIVAPSPIPADSWGVPRELTTEEISNIPAAFAAAARRASEAGFDFVQLHGAHGYLLHQFLSPFSNQRTDCYGGSLENRARLLLETVTAVREVLPETKPLMVRLSVTEWVEGGFDIDESIEVVRWLDEAGVDMVDVSTGANVPARIPVGPGYQVRFAEQIRRATGMVTGAVGLILNAAQAEQILVSGQADVVHMGRALLREPALPIRMSAELGHRVDYIPGQYANAWR